MSGFSHVPVMLAEVLKWLAPGPGGVWVDGTIGGGGHAAEVLKATSPDGVLVGLDRDEAAMEAAARRLEEYGRRAQLARMNFSRMEEVVAGNSVRGVLLDLGVSSHQLDTAERGFSFGLDGPLDMRMDRRSGVTAAELLARSSAEELARIFWENADERDSRRIARVIVKAREQRPLTRTGQLAELIERISPRGGRKSHPATRVFQALRVEVNDEIGALREGLGAAMRVLAPGGRLVVITFDSLQDRVTKRFMREEARDYDVEGEVDLPAFRKDRSARAFLPVRKAVTPSEAEVQENPRARSAQIRVLEKLGN